jgi:hypothetical protein
MNKNSVTNGCFLLGRVDGFDQDEAESKRDERAVILRRLLASKCDTLEAFELADRLFDACPCLVECFRKEGGHILGVGSIRDCRTYSALARARELSVGKRRDDNLQVFQQRCSSRYFGAMLFRRLAAPKPIGPWRAKRYLASGIHLPANPFGQNVIPSRAFI